MEEKVEHNLPVVTADAIAPAAVDLDVPTRMHLTNCDQCGVGFSLPLEMFLRRMADKSEIYCPAGHANRLAPSPDDDADLLAMNLRTLGQLAQLRHELAVVRDTLARMPAHVVVPIDAKELARRINSIISRADRRAFGRPLCRFCGKLYSNNTSFKTHLKRTHVQEVSELPAVAC